MEVRSLKEGASGLGLEGEREWQYLRRQFELAAHPWIGFIFCPAPGQVAVLRGRTEFMLQSRTKHLQRIAPGSPGVLRELMPQLFESLSKADCVWVEAIAVDGPLSDDEEGSWAAAWDWLMMRINEQRDAFRRQLKGALVFAVHPTWKPRVRNAAPDLWSVRSLVLDLAGKKARTNYSSSASSLINEADDSGEYVPNLHDALAALRRLAAAPSPDPQSLARLHMRAAFALLAADRTSDAVEQAEQALEMLQNQNVRLRAQALVAAAHVKRADNDVGAVGHYLAEAIHLWRAILDEGGETPQTLRDLSRALLEKGDLYINVGDTTVAKVAYEEALAIGRRLVETTGSTPQTLRDLSVSLSKMCDLHHSAGDSAAAKAAYKESLALARQLMEATGETPLALHDISVSLDRIGDIHGSAGDEAAAKAAYEESLALRRHLLEMAGETPQVLGDLAGVLDRMGDIHYSAGEMASAKAACDESLALRRQLAEVTGETPDVLRGLSISFGRMGDIHRVEGDMAAAEAAFEESLALDRRLVEIAGETPQALRDLSVSLDRIEDLHRSTGNMAAAEAVHEESQVIRGRLDSTFG